ncbi:MAG: aldehyde dehydrogenase family protein, partial [Solobacterium sp.]|nr:aldehyde dehydrogenase family protein [Solobacterium sp.]
MAKEKKAVETNENPAYQEVDEKVQKALKALDEYANYDQEKIDYIVAKCSVAALDKHGELAKLAIEETGRGVFEDKATKNLFACEYVVNHMRNQKTVGIIDEGPVKGLKYVPEPVGVIAGITPVTTPTSTAIF